MNIERCKRCERFFIMEDLSPDGMCDTCYSGAMPQWAIDLARKLRALPEEVDLYDWARYIVSAKGSALAASVAERCTDQELYAAWNIIYGYRFLNCLDLDIQVVDVWLERNNPESAA